MEQTKKRLRKLEKQVYTLMDLPPPARQVLFKHLTVMDIIYASKAFPLFGKWMDEKQQWDYVCEQLVLKDAKRLGNNAKWNCFAWYFAIVAFQNAKQSPRAEVLRFTTGHDTKCYIDISVYERVFMQYMNMTVEMSSKCYHSAFSRLFDTLSTFENTLTQFEDNLQVYDVYHTHEDMFIHLLATAIYTCMEQGLYLVLDVDTVLTSFKYKGQKKYFNELRNKV